MLVECFQDLIEIRPGRKIFVRHWISGVTEESSLLSSSTTLSISTINLVCVHGTAARHEQYIPFWRHLDAFISENQASLRIHCWAYDAIGCGSSPKLSDGTARDYQDVEQVQDLKALLKDHVDSTYELFLAGHSYGPNWIYKYLQQDEQPPKISGLVLISTALECKEVTIPLILRFGPLWLLNCIQSLLTASFLQLGYSAWTREHNPQMIEAAKDSNNRNDMQVCLHYYNAHDWVCSLNKDEMPPALVLHGAQDEIIPIKCGQHVSNQLGTELVSIDRASHMVLLEQPKEVARHVLAFLLQHI
jgi:pimeloyl-ACP methyl ester carboxylesterase